MSYKKIIDKEKEIIIKELRENGYSNKIIDYSHFLSLYEKYKDLMGELEFAYILGLNYDRFKNLRTKGTKTLILKQRASEELKTEIIESLIEQGYINKRIDYSEFLSIYENYKKMITEKEFAEIIGITYPRYRNIKNKGGKTKVLETKIDETEIIEEIRNKYGNMLIGYTTFLEMYEEYKKIINNEIEFARIIGLSSTEYNFIKSGRKATILRDYISEEASEEIQARVIEQGYANREITYSEFLMLYNPYRSELTEQQFARALRISNIKHRNMKYYNNKTFVLKEKKEITSDREKEIRKELIKKGYANKSLKYDEFLDLYSRYKNELNEVQFARILGISYGNYSFYKNRKESGAVILKTEEVKEEILEKISNDNKIKSVYGIYINYEEFLNLYGPYSNYMTETQFAQIIGIPESNFGNIKKYNVKVDKHSGLTMRIKHIIRESRIYNIGEIQGFCDKYNLTLNEFLGIVCNTKDIDTIRENEEILVSKGLFIGRKPIDDEVLDKYGSKIISFIDLKSKIFGKLYKQNRYSDDVASDTIMYITQKRGDLFVNYEIQNALYKAKKIANKYIKYSYITKMRVRNDSIDRLNDELGDHHTYTVDKKQNVEDRAISKIKRESKDKYEQCINLLKYYYDLGHTSTEAIDKVALELELKKETMLEMMKKALIEKKRLKQTSKGEYYLGE